MGRPQNALPKRYIIGGQYCIEDILGMGGFGVTYRAWDMGERRWAVLKELYPRNDVYRSEESFGLIPVAGQEGYFEYVKKRFREEAQILHDFLREPSVLDVYRLIEENNTVYYSMECIEGMDMRACLLERGKLDWPLLSSYVKDILRTLYILHGEKLIHRDISPDNIYLTKGGQAKLIDFGSVRCYDTDRSLTTILKPTYAPVEQYMTRGDQGPWTDIYALSVTMYHVLSGVRPARAPERVEEDPVVGIQKLSPRLPSHAADSIMKGMSVRPEERFQDVGQMAKALFPGEQIFTRERPAGEAYQIQCICGQYCGRSWPMSPGEEITVGRDPACSICYALDPGKSTGISRKQCIFRFDSQNGLMVMDLHSSYGTLLSGHAVRPDEWYPISKGSCISFAGEVFLIG